MAIDKEILVEIYAQILTIRRFEEQMLALLKAGELISSPSPLN